MNPSETRRLYAYWAAAKSGPWRAIREVKGRRIIKGRGKAVGQVLKHSRVTSEIRLLEV